MSANGYEMTDNSSNLEGIKFIDNDPKSIVWEYIVGQKIDQYSKSLAFYGRGTKDENKTHITGRSKTGIVLERISLVVNERRKSPQEKNHIVIKRSFTSKELETSNSEISLRNLICSTKQNRPKFTFLHINFKKRNKLVLSKSVI